MLDDVEWIGIQQAWSNAFRNQGSIEEQFQPLKDLYFNLTGHRETNENAIMHHRISQYGNACERCGKPFRTPEAAFCAACGWRPES